MDDGAILSQVRAIYVRNAVDTTYLQIDVTNKAVFVKGIFTVTIYGVKKGGQQSAAEATKIKDEVRRTLRNIEQQIIGIGEIKSLNFEYDNWSRSPSGWVEKHK
jgi:hypothetical protein